MAKNYVQEGEILELVAPSGGVVSGQGYIHGDLFVVALETKAQTVLYRAKRRGVFRLAKLSTDNMATVGTHLSWDDTNKRFQITATAGMRKFGCNVEVAAGTTTEVDVLLHGNPTAVNP